MLLSSNSGSPKSIVKDKGSDISSAIENKSLVEIVEGKGSNSFIKISCLEGLVFNNIFIPRGLIFFPKFKTKSLKYKDPSISEINDFKDVSKVSLLTLLATPLISLLVGEISVMVKGGSVDVNIFFLWILNINLYFPEVYP